MSDSAEVLDFFQALGYKENDTLYIRRFHDKDKKQASCNMQCTLSQWEDIHLTLKKYNQDGYGIFFVVNGGGHNDKAVKTCRAQFIDFDDFTFEEQWKRINEFALKPSIVIKTRKSLHCYWLIDNGDIKQFRLLQERLNTYFGSDQTIKNESRVMRVPGFYHNKSDPVMVEIISFDRNLTYTQQQLFDALPDTPKTKEGVKFQSNKGLLQLPDVIPEGHRHEVMNKIAGSMRAKGFSTEAIEAAIRAENKRMFPPFTEEELQKEVLPVLKREWKITHPYYQKAVCDSELTENIQLLSLDDFEEKEPEWLIEGYIPKYQITVMGGDGGSGKTALWCNIAAAISSGNFSVFEAGYPEDFKAEPQKVIFFSSEDSIIFTLKGRLRKNGAIAKNILSVSLENSRFAEIKTNSQALENILAIHKPALCILDPLQSFIPSDIQMGSRNAMRAALNPLIGLGEKHKTTFLIICHANKQSGVWGRKRLGESSDIWDIARSVLMVGTTNENGVRYVSQEKSNYGKLSDTVLFSVNDGVAEFKSISDKKDKDFVVEVDYTTRQAPQREEAKEFIIEFLKDGEKEVADLDEIAIASGISKATLKRAKAEMKKDKIIIIRNSGFGEKKKFYISLSQSEKVS